MIKSFRGQMGTGDQQRLSLHTNDGKTGYRIVKFEIISARPLNADVECAIKIYTHEQTTVDPDADFSDTTLLAYAMFAASTDTIAAENAQMIAVIFDRQIFNQDIYITYSEQIASERCNYYIELEQIPLDLNASTVATLQSIRSA